MPRQAPGERSLAAPRVPRVVATQRVWGVWERPRQEQERRARLGKPPRRRLFERIDGGLPRRHFPDVGRNRAASCKSVDYIRRPACVVDRLTCADLPSDLTSHARVPVSGPGGTFGLDPDEKSVECVSHEHQAAPKGSVLSNRTLAPTRAGKEGTRPWPSSLHDSSWRAASTSDTRPAVGTRRESGSSSPNPTASTSSICNSR